MSIGWTIIGRPVRVRAVALPPALSQTDWLMDYERTVGELAAAHPELHPFDAAAPGTGPHAQRREFPCEPLNSQRRAENVHELMPSDIAAVGVAWLQEWSCIRAS